MTDLSDVLDKLNTGQISIRQAAELMGWQERGEATTCATCKHLRGTMCHLPNQPARPEHPDSVRCGSYETDDPRDHALPYQPPKRGGMMFK